MELSEFELGVMKGSEQAFNHGYINGLKDILDQLLCEIKVMREDRSSAEYILSEIEKMMKEELNK